MSKAIVQAVEQQGGRFLDRNKKLGYWYQVSYKRAVDKTSQGLRERERDEEDDDPNTHVPESFQGRSKEGPNLKDLADVAIAHATRTTGLPRTSQAFADEKKRPQQSAPIDSSSFSKRTRYESQPFVGRPPPPRDDMLDDTPLPPTLELRQSSMFRLLKQTPLFSGGKSWADFSHPNARAPVPPPQGQIMGQMRTYPTKLNKLQLGGNNRNLTSPPQQAPPPPPPPAGMFSFASSMFAAPSQVAPTVNNAAPPPFARLTSQVSDWLTSFFPVANRNETLAPAPAPAQPMQTTFGGFSDFDEVQFAQQRLNADPFESSSPPQDNNAGYSQQQETMGLNSQQTSDPRRLLGLDRLVAPDIQEQLKIPPALPNPSDVTLTIPPHGPNTERKTNKRKSRSSMPPLPYASVDSESPSAAWGSTFADDQEKRPSEAVPAPPTELEHSVSTTLLKLASSPSTFLQNLTSFFDRNETTAFIPPSGQPEVHPPSMMVRRTSKPKKSLLDDDDDEDPREAALRTVPRF